MICGQHDVIDFKSITEALTV